MSAVIGIGRQMWLIATAPAQTRHIDADAGLVGRGRCRHIFGNGHGNRTGVRKPRSLFKSVLVAINLNECRSATPFTQVGKPPT